MNTSRRYRVGFVDWDYTSRFCGNACSALDVEVIDRLTIRDEEKISHCDLVVVQEEYTSAAMLVLHEARRRQVPTLHVMDGMLEWRNSWENPTLKSPFLRPVVSDKVACIGRSQVRILESWGNRGKCEVVGAPRLDPLLDRPQLSRPSPGSKTILVMSAKTPFFTPGQRQLVLTSFLDLKSWLDAHNASASDPIAVQWRVAPEIAEYLELQDPNAKMAPENLWQQFDSVDAVISTPSTAALEAMLHGLPVALLDYTNSPQYLVAAWSITARPHLDSTIPELFRPSDERLRHQKYVLHDALECRSPAGPRLAGLMESMIEARWASAASGSPCIFRERILPVGERTEPALPGEGSAPGSGGIQSADSSGRIALMQNELVYWKDELKTLTLRLTAQTELARELDGRLQRYERYGCGTLLARLVATFPFPRRMLRAIGYWIEERRASAGRQLP